MCSVRSESLGRARYQWKGITQDVNIRRQGPFQRLPTMRLVGFLMYEALPLDPTSCSLYTEALDYSVNFMGLGVCALVECSSHLFFLPPTLQFLFSICSSFLASSVLLLLSVITSCSVSPFLSLSSHSLSSHLPFRIQVLYIFPATMSLTAPLSAHRDHGQPAILDAGF